MNKGFLPIIFASCALCLCACVSGSSESSSLVSSEDTVSILQGNELSSNYIAWRGRHYFSSDKEYFYYTATGFKIEFFGRIIDLELELEDKNSDIYYSLSRDDQDLLDADVYVQSASEKLRVEFDTYSKHSIELIKRSEPEDGVTSLKKVTTNGYFLPFENLSTEPLHFLLIGASGISGHGALGEPNQKRTTTNSSSLHSFGYLTAHAFSGTYEFVSNSGWGIKYGYNDLTGNVNIVEAYEKVGIDSNQNLVDVDYNHDKKADVVIVNAGGNDYSAVINKATGFDKEEKVRAFKTQVANFILKLRSDNPTAHIFWTMTEGSLNGNAALQVINQLDEADLNHVHMVTIEDVGSNGDAEGADNHASYATHQRSSAILVEAINQILN
ncbi:MAG: hypothetical protein LKF69_01290 [Bacilli bacterium]|jgi:hypothetical protein|nr:hypothetical protein [Bacilli bacterium]MCH4235425.1 hypothetical protein [Bacilli bacterium]